MIEALNKSGPTDLFDPWLYIELGDLHFSLHTNATSAI